MNDVAFFDKSPYESPPSPIIRQMLAKLAPLGKAVIACRGDGFSANILGTVYVGKDGDDPVLRGTHPYWQDKCTCHVHIKWNEVCGYALKKENVGYGPEAVIYLLDEHGEPIVRIFYPKRNYAQVEAALASEEMRVAPPKPNPFRYVFMLGFESEENLNAYVEFWHEISALIQQEAGALGTRLHRVRGGFAVLAIAEWESKEARVSAYERIRDKYPPEHKIHWQSDRFWGKHIFIVEADEIDMTLS